MIAIKINLTLTELFVKLLPIEAKQLIKKQDELWFVNSLTGEIGVYQYINNHFTNITYIKENDYLYNVFHNFFYILQGTEVIRCYDNIIEVEDAT